MSRRFPGIVLGLVAVLVLTILGFDLMRNPEEQWSARALLAGIDTYQSFLSSKVEKSGVRCRFRPTCSHYAKAVIRRDGALVGSWRAAGRIARCGPWTPDGTEDQP